MTDNIKELDTLMLELKNVIENSEDLTYDDVMNEIQVAYKAAGIAATESVPEKAEEIKQYLMKLNELAESKKEKKVKKTSLKDMKAGGDATPEVKSAESVMDVPPTVEVGSYDEKIRAEDENNVGMEYEKKEKTIPKPARQCVEQEPPVIPKPVLEPEIEVEVKEEKPVPQPEKSVPKIPKPVGSEAKQPIEIMEPETAISENIIVQNTQEESEVEETTSAEDDLYNDLEDIFVPKPFDGDDDDDDINAAPKQKLEAQTKEEVEAERIKEIDQEYNNLPEDTQILGVKSISRKKVSETLKTLASLDTSGLDIQKLEMFDFNIEDQNIRRDYLKTRNDMISAPKISRVAMLMSGHYQEISAYGNYDLISVERNIYSQQISYPEKERLLMESIYAHVNYVSYSKEKPSFEEWAKNTFYPDMPSLYYAVYDANSVGPNHYLFDCPYCGQEISVNKKNSELSVGVPKEMSKDDLETFITNKDIMSVDSSKLSRWAKTTIVRKILPNSKVIVDFAVPSIYDYLTSIFTLDKINHRDLGGKLDLSLLDGFTYTTEEEQEQQIEDFNRIIACIYIKQISIPTKIEGSNKLRYIKITSKADIIEHVNGFDEDDYSDLLRGDDIRDIITKTATRYYLRDCNCTNEHCGKTIKYVSINPKQIFFFKIGEGREKRMMR